MKCRKCYEQGVRVRVDDEEELAEHIASHHPEAPADPFAPQVHWALLQRWEAVQTIIPMESEPMARDYLSRWTRWVRNEVGEDASDKLPQLLRSEVKWEVVE